MKLKKLDVRGFSHEIVVLAVLVIFSIAGVGYVVAGHADPSKGTTSIAGGSAKNTELSCKIDDLPETATYKQLLKPYVRISNIGSAQYVGEVTVQVTRFDAETHAFGKAPSTANARQVTIKKGKTVKIPLPKYRVPYANPKGVVKIHYSANIEGLGYCNNSWVKLPQKPVQPKTKKSTPTTKPKSQGGSDTGLSGGGEG